VSLSTNRIRAVKLRLFRLASGNPAQSNSCVSAHNPKEEVKNFVKNKRRVYWA